MARLRTARVRWRDVPSQEGRRFIVTGANSGVGLETARALVAAGADVVLACRSVAKGQAAADSMAGLAGSARVVELDLSSLDSVRRFAGEVDDVDVLVNNAGIMGVPFQLSPDGVEMQFATNHLGHFALTLLLMRRLTDRVVVVSSQAHRAGALDVDDLGWRRREYQPFAAYGASKLATLVFLGELARRLTARGSTLRATGAHPGTTASAITGSTGKGWVTKVGGWGHELVGMPAAQGALPTLYAATMDVPTNSYFGPDRLREMRGYPVAVGRSHAATDPALGARLWACSEELTGLVWGAE